MTPTESIVNALAPGVALTSGIFYASGLQARFSQISQRVRDLNKEARGLSAGTRLESVRWQVELLTKRAHVVQRAILVQYAALLSFISTILILLLGGYFGAAWLLYVGFATFSAGLIAMASAFVLSTTELTLSNRTLVEDVRTSFPPPPDTPKG